MDNPLQGNIKDIENIFSNLCDSYNNRPSYCNINVNSSDYTYNNGTFNSDTHQFEYDNNKIPATL